MAKIGGQNGIRSFIGIFPPPEIQSAVEKVQSLLKVDGANVKWEPKEKFHVTMKFLGSVFPQNIKQIQKLLTDNLESLLPFEIALTSVGCFPSPNNPRVFWIGSSALDENVSLKTCFELIEKACIESGCEKEVRPFHPHITLGRTKGRQPATSASGNVSPRLINILESATFEPMTFRCRQVSVMRSILHPSGSSYSTQCTIPLKQ